MARFAPRILMAAVAVLLLAQPAAAQRAVFVVRHAEKQSESNEPGVPLSEAGRARADRLAALLKNAGVTAIYSTDFVRTLATAEPLARALKIAVRKYSATGKDGNPDLQPLAARLKAEHPRDTVLVVGHSNTVPPLLKALGCSESIEIAASQYDDLFAVVPGVGGSATLLRLTY
jgi:2,3-bisphosphoglycerate-dependent phosphoglycerate mutase